MDALSAGTPLASLAGRGDERLALVEVLDRDGLARQSLSVSRWPVRIGRALDNDLVLGDAHVAAHHLSIEMQGDRLALVVADTRNGLRLGRERLRAGERSLLAGTGEPVDLIVGRTHLRLRLAGGSLAPEVPLDTDRPALQRLAPMLLAAMALVGGVLYQAYLGADPDELGRVLGTTLLSALMVSAVWCTAWALLSKMFTRQAHFGWHLRVYVFAGLALLAVTTLLPLLAFMFSSPWLSSFDSAAVVAVLAAGLYFHLLSVEPARRRALRWAALAFAVAGGALATWFNLQRLDQFGDDLYLSHLYPPAFRLHGAVPVDRFVDGLGALKGSLDRKARIPGNSHDGPFPANE